MFKINMLTNPKAGRDIHTGLLPSLLSSQIDSAFDNVLAALTTINRNLSWRDVVSVKSYHVGLDDEGVAYFVSLDLSSFFSPKLFRDLFPKLPRDLFPTLSRDLFPKPSREREKEMSNAKGRARRLMCKLGRRAETLVRERP